MSTSSGSLIARRLGVLRTTRPPDRLTIRLPPYCFFPFPVRYSHRAAGSGTDRCRLRRTPPTGAARTARRKPGPQPPAAGYAGDLPRLSRDFPDKQPTDFTPQDLQRYLAARRAAGCGDATIRHAVNALRSFFAYHHSPAAASLPMPRPKRRIQRTLTFDQALAVLAACDTSTTIGKRDLALVALMLDTGLRAREVWRLRLDDLNVDPLLLKVVVKGGQEKFGVYAPETANILAAWLAERATVARGNAPTVFVALGGLKPGQALPHHGLRRIFARLGQAAGFKLSPHDLRRTFATLAITLGAPTRMVQLWGRWENIQEVQRYTEALTAHGFERYSPIRAILRGLEP